MRHHERINAYSEDLTKAVEAVKKRGMPEIETARTFSMSTSSVRRFFTVARDGKSLAPPKRPGSKPKASEALQVLGV